MGNIFGFTDTTKPHFLEHFLWSEAKMAILAPATFEINGHGNSK